MNKLYSKSVRIFLFSLLSVAAIANGVYAFDQPLERDSSKTKNVKTTSKITDTRKNKPTATQQLKFNFVPYKPYSAKDLSPVAAAKQGKADNDKVLSNVKVYPNPVEDELNLSYHISKDCQVTIRIMDVLGNEITTLFSQKLTAGDQTNSFNISSRLNSGFYFVRFVAGNETPVIKRISVL